MAPKKQPQKKKQNPNQKGSSSSKPKSQSADPKPTPKLQISAENERRLRRLLLNSDRPTAPSPSPVDATISKSQKAKKLRNIYEKLSCEGFNADQIEQSLSALNDGATFEAALDWLCLNVPGNELPLKFSSGTNMLMQEGAERSINIISAAREDWVPSRIPSAEVEDQMPGVSVRIKGHQDDESLDFGKPSQADWIRQYVQQQEEEEWEALSSDANDKGSTKEATDPCSRAVSIAKEYHAARLAAVEAKEKWDKKNQERAGHIIRKLKQEMSSLGLSDDILVSGFGDENTLNCMSEAIICDSTSSKDPEFEAPCIVRSRSEFTLENEPIIDGNGMEDCSKVFEGVVDPFDVPVPVRVSVEDEQEEVEFSNLFSDDASVSGSLPPEVLKMQRKEKIAQSGHGQILGKLDELWKKGDPAKIPKAILQQLCQRLGWEAPKYSKVFGKEKKFSYAVSVLRTAIGRGKSRKAGGLITLQLPDQDETFESAEDSQNRVAAFALYRLFPDLPTHQLILEPYSSLIRKWQEAESLTKLEDTEEIRRAGFVDSLLNVDNDGSTSTTVTNDSFPEEHAKPYPRENAPTAKAERTKHRKEVESSFLKQELENKMKLQKYKKMLEARAALPIAELKSHLLKLLKENDVLVVCGETGCGKTTQVPQFILDDMVESSMGGYCSIVCTQPRRIAAISVAERVADERCEPSPGSDGSLVGYQVRLDSARNEKTKLLFCTTGILLRKLAGDKDLADITHVIVDEVHERSLLGDFLLIVLKSLIERQSAHGTQKLKVILMSATVDANLFSKYFGNCPIITAKGRTHPVSTYFLEDVYENIKYCLASDSPASLTTMAPTREKLRSSRVDNHRGKKNLVMSGWGDESVLSESYINPHYEPKSYESYSDRTRQNLKNLNEDVIDYDLLEDLVCYVDETYPAGAILVFLPGVAEIYMLVDKLAASYQFGGSSSEWLLPLHSSLASAEQRKVFQSPPENIRKVIVATDIAETSITIDDVVYVIDCGKHKENRYNPQKKMSSMVEDWISQANARQRRGRAGRVKPGICFCLYTCHRFEKLMRPYQVPEMLRLPLVELCLQIKSLSLGDITSFLLKVGAIEGDEELTPLGYNLAKLPVDVLIGKMMLYGGIFGCLSPILSIAGFLSYKSPFVYPKDEKQNVERAKSSLLMEKLDNVSEFDEGSRQSDHLLMVVAYNKWVKILHEKGTKAAHQFCNSYFLNSSVMYMIRDMRIQFGSLLADIGIINLPKRSLTDGKMKDKLDSWFADMSQPFNKYSHHSSVVKSVLCAGLYPNVAATEEGIVAGSQSSNRTLSANPTGRPLWYDGRREVHIHPSSINNNIKAFQYPFLVFLEKVETSKVFLRDTSIVSPYSILLFGGPINIQHQTGLVTIDGWLKLTAPAQTAVLFKELRLTLHSVLKELIRKPEMVTVVDNEIVRSIIHLLLEEDKPLR
ncbi:DExH-box ATP-dependent RNA helicase DExH7, chloroplastic isoform X2 [Magnolia sinica]|uniref:DExH-box ATP-dependent RNA helicase DExH7, chloroplastic isoform X2 n=1 Tax=Magnolia sinica TaxID=86752 RepID=UPI00265923D3|nr:DExH-box ATP-dependent RNA helicase DExH7, chloroplastic isoform X2 [Magnolia sinica]